MVRVSGRAVVFSTVTLAVGFWVGVFSAFVPTVHFAVLAGAAFLLGLISQFVLLPLSLLLFQPLGRPAMPVGPRPGRLVLALTGIAIGLIVVGGARAQEARHDILLKDQFGTPDGPGRHTGQTVVLIYGKVDGMRRMKAWEEGIRKQVPGAVVVLRGLDARSVRNEKTEAEVNERLQQVVPPDITILVDWKGDFVRAYGLPDADVSVTILDAKGTACHTAAGPVTRETLDVVRQLFLKVRTAGTCQ
jgi:hypothetical protein